MEAAVFEQIEQTLTSKGAGAAIDELCRIMQERKEYGHLFYALLLKKRNELGVSPIPTEPNQALPQAVHGPYEDAIRQAARRVGQLYLDQGDIPRAWAYFQMIEEARPVAEAIESFQLSDSEESQQVIEIAFHHGVHPRKGFDWILERYGICNAITTVGGHEFRDPDIRTYCIAGLVRALYEQLRERLLEEVGGREGPVAGQQSVAQLIRGRDWLFADDAYHVDASHLSAVVQMSIYLPPGQELELARELCIYGGRLSRLFQYAGEPPFEDQYHDYGLYLDALAAQRVEEAIAHFRAKAEATDPDSAGTYPAEVFVNLLVRLDRPQEALAAATRLLAKTENTRLACPSIVELCKQANQYQSLVEVSRQRGDPVHFLAALLKSQNNQ
jgi:hypothetical protein